MISTYVKSHFNNLPHSKMNSHLFGTLISVLMKTKFSASLVMGIQQGHQLDSKHPCFFPPSCFCAWRFLCLECLPSFYLLSELLLMLQNPDWFSYALRDLPFLPTNIKRRLPIFHFLPTFILAALFTLIVLSYNYC